MNRVTPNERIIDGIDGTPRVLATQLTISPRAAESAASERFSKSR
ncbi:hypothetical protein [Halorarum salinum]|nr:hypothetical protein [Halobaculum salinum]